MEATIVVDGDVDLILRESGKVGGDLKLALLLEHVAVEIELIGDAADQSRCPKRRRRACSQLWRDETTTGDEEGCEAVRRAGRESTERGEERRGNETGDVPFIMRCISYSMSERGLVRLAPKGERRLGLIRPGPPSGRPRSMPPRGP